MPFPVSYNPTYNPEGLVNDKYNPLLEPEASDFQNLGEETTTDLKGLFTERLKAFAWMKAPKEEDFFYYSEVNPGTLIKNENTCTQFPIAVLSSNRSQGISRCLNGTTSIKENIEDVMSITSFQNGTADSVFYDPLRVNGTDVTAANQRYIYLFVNILEYKEYAEQLKGLYQTKTNKTARLILIGWSIVNDDAVFSKGQKYSPLPLGFGATRMVVLQFFKNIFQKSVKDQFSAKTNQKVFLTDDDVAYISGFPGFDVIDNKWTDGLVSMGFIANTVKITTKILYDKIKSSYKAPTFELEPGFMQQAAVWNLSKLKSLNFSPIFVTGKEDMSLDVKIKLAQPNPSTYAPIVKGTSIFKINLGQDVVSENLIKSSKEQLSKLLLSLTELEVKGKDAGSVACSLESFITSHIGSKGYNVEDAVSKAVEQIMTAAIQNKQNSLIPEGLFETYKDSKPVCKMTTPPES